MLALQAGIEDQLSPRELFAVLVHDLGKALTPEEELPSHRGHESKGKMPVGALCDRLKVPKSYRQLALGVCEYHLQLHRIHELKPTTILKLIEALDGFRNKQRLVEFINCCRADARGRTGKETDPYLQGEKLLRCYRAAAAVDTQRTAEQQRSWGTATGEQIKVAIQRARIAEIKKVLPG